MRHQDTLKISLKFLISKSDNQMLWGGFRGKVFCLSYLKSHIVLMFPSDATNLIFSRVTKARWPWLLPWSPKLGVWGWKNRGFYSHTAILVAWWQLEVSAVIMHHSYPQHSAGLLHLCWPLYYPYTTHTKIKEQSAVSMKSLTGSVHSPLVLKIFSLFPIHL